jgi:hypothetical protein
MMDTVANDMPLAGDKLTTSTTWASDSDAYHFSSMPNCNVVDRLQLNYQEADSEVDFHVPIASSKLDGRMDTFGIQQRRTMVSPIFQLHPWSPSKFADVCELCTAYHIWMSQDESD